MPGRPLRRGTVLVAAVTTALLAVTLSGCATLVQGVGRSALPPVAADAQVDIVGDAHTAFDRDAANAIADVEAFWVRTYPSVAGGAALPPLAGGVYSVDPSDITAADRRDACVARAPDAIKDNALYCPLDDSVVYSRTGFVPQLARTYGDFFVAMMFAHEFGHAVQHRLGIADPPALIILETQADCFAGAFLGAVLAGRAPHWKVTSGEVNSVLEGYIQLRDPEGASPTDEGSHGNGFDRLSAVATGINSGATACVDNWDQRQFTERPYTTQSDYDNAGNQPEALVLDPSPANPDGTGGGGLQPDLDAFWSGAASSVGRTWRDVDFRVVDRLPCRGATSNSGFAYCSDTNTVAITRPVADAAYQAGDFALGALIAYGWGMAVRHQLFGRDLSGAPALLAAACYTGAYARDVNVDQPPRGFALSPPDMDEASVATLALVGSDRTFGARGTTGLQRITSFTNGYFHGLSSC